MSNIKQIFYRRFSAEKIHAMMQNNHDLKFNKLNRRLRHRTPRGKCFVRLLKLDKETKKYWEIEHEKTTN